MKKSDLKTEIRNRILEKKAKMAEAEGDEDEDEEEGEEEKPKKTDRVDSELISKFDQHLNSNKDGFDAYEIKKFNLPSRKALLNTFLDYLATHSTGREINLGDLQSIISSRLSNQSSLEEEDVEEMSTSGGAGAYQTKYAFKLPKDYKKVSEGQIEPKQKKKD